MTVHETLTAIEELLPTLRERAQETENARRVPAESIKALQEIGFFKLLQPERYDGYQTDPATFYSAVALLASACGSTGWVASVLGVPPWHVALFDLRAQNEVWGGDTDTRVCSSYGLTGTATPADGGFRLSGRWGFASGCDHAAWALLGARIVEDGAPVDSGTFLVPLGDYRIEDIWDAIGLRGTGSNDLIADDVFVPAHRVLGSAAVAACVTPGQAVNDAPLYRIPFGSIHTSAITAPIIGMARGAYAAHLEHQRDRVRVALPGDATKESGFTGTSFKDDPAALMRIAEAASDIDAAWLQLTHNISALHALAEAGTRIPAIDRLRVRRDQVRGTERAISAVDRLFENSGGRALRAGTAIQRFWRDAHAGRAHAANDPERAYRMFGAAALAPPGAGSPAPTRPGAAAAERRQ